MPIFLTVLGLMLTADALWWHRADRFLRPVPGARWWRLGLGAFMAGQIFLLLWAIFARWVSEGFDRSTPVVLIAATYIWHLLALPTLVLLWMLSGLFAGLRTLVRRLFGALAETTEAAPAAAPGGAAAGPSLTRRRVLGAAAAAAPPLLTGITAAASLPGLEEFRVRPMDVPIPGLPKDLDGLTIAHVTDIHVGRFTEGRMLRRIVEETNRLDADLVLLTGDLINNALADLPAGLEAVLKMQARYGVWNCEGNHDLIEDRRAFETRTKAAGVNLLLNEQHTLTVRGHPVQLLGLRWGRGRQAMDADMRDLLTLRRPDAFPILLAHHPHAFDNAAAAAIPLTLAGHTHGGQLMLNERLGAGPVMFRYWSGLYRKGDSRLVVSNGVGNWFPLRTRAPAEIVHVTLRRPR